MKVREIIDKLELEIVVENNLDAEVKGGYVGDLLSNVMAKAEANDIWLTIQGHQNVVAVALLSDITAVILVEDFQMEEKARRRAREKGINILASKKSAFTLAGKLYQMGLD